MSSLVQELQMDALDEKVSMSSILRKAYVLSRKLNISEIQDWLSQETYGYKENPKSIPEYRKVDGKVESFNPINGWLPVIFEDKEREKIFSCVPVSEPISSLESLIKSDSPDLAIRYNTDMEAVLRQNINYVSQFHLRIPKHEVEQIVNRVRQLILEWALKLEEDGILGEGMSFSMKEKEEAAQHSYTNIVNNMPNMNNSQLQQGTNGSIQTLKIKLADYNSSDLNELSKIIKVNLPILNLDDQNKEKIIAEVKVIEEEAKIEVPNSNKITNALSSIKRILEGTASGMTARIIMDSIAGIMN